MSHAAQAAGLLGLASSPGWSRADDGTIDVGPMVSKAVNFLKARQADDGSWSKDRKEPGITALVVTALLRTKRVLPADPIVTKALTHLEQFLGPKGGLSEAPHANYTTAIALMAFQAANTGGKYDRIIKGGQDFLRTMQWDEGESKGRDSDFYGGAGYGGRNSRPDLSNTAFMIQALRDTGLPDDDPALKRALVFVSRARTSRASSTTRHGRGR